MPTFTLTAVLNIVKDSWTAAIWHIGWQGKLKKKSNGIKIAHAGQVMLNWIFELFVKLDSK